MVLLTYVENMRLRSLDSQPLVDQHLHIFLMSARDENEMMDLGFLGPVEVLVVVVSSSSAERGVTSYVFHTYETPRLNPQARPLDKTTAAREQRSIIFGCYKKISYKSL